MNNDKKEIEISDSHQEKLDNTPLADGGGLTADEPQDAVATADKRQSDPSDDDNIATAEDMAAFIRDRKAKKAQKKDKEEEDRDVFGEYRAPANSIDPYLEPDPTLPWPKSNTTRYLSRGCHNCPKSYTPVNIGEVQSCSKVTACDWLRDIRWPSEKPFDIVEVRFKNNRKDFYRIPDGINVTTGDVVAVEGTPGHDVGIVCLTGEICRLQMQKQKVSPDDPNIKKLFRRAKATDIERWEEAIREEDAALIKTRQIAADLGLEMKVNDVEYQGDHSKAIFYYTADDRVDFRDLIKKLAEEFKVRIEMKQIGVRQESGKVGGIGTCGRELCCSTWLTNFRSVTTNAAKVQQILPNPQKLAGQCGKLKCCLNFEYEVYADALKEFPPANTPIRFQKGLAMHKKTDVLRGIMWYAYEGDNELYAIPAASVKKLIEMNRNQEYPERLEDYKTELMGSAALTQEASSAEVERELQRLSDAGTSENGTEQGGDRRQRDNDRRGPRRNERQPREQNGRKEHRNDERLASDKRRQVRPNAETPKTANVDEHRGQQPRDQRQRNPHRNPKEVRAQDNSKQKTK